MSAIIKVENASKQYRLGEVGTGSFHHDLNRWWHRVRGKEDPYLKIGETNDRSTKGSSDYVWALKDISFDVQPGEVLGIIGRNGAGKSTLLKILSRTTTPTTGSIKMKGRVASLLEVGTGFHPDLSGRENIYLNGAILGMRRQEIDRKLEEIIDFAGVERYIDTPVKRYSSGMYVRLAFAVAAHLEPEILIVDEVLAVGDAEFQKKCLGKMKDVSTNEGRTVLFVSHNMDAVQQLTSKCLFLFNGKVHSEGNTRAVVSEYMNYERIAYKEYKFQIYSVNPFFTSIDVLISDQNSGVHEFGKPLKIMASFNSLCIIDSLEFAFQIVSADTNAPVTYLWFSTANELRKIEGKNGNIQLTVNVDSLRLYQGEYYFKFYLSDPRGKIVFENIEYFFPFKITMGGNIINEWGWREGICHYIEQSSIEVAV